MSSCCNRSRIRRAKGGVFSGGVCDGVLEIVIELVRVSIRKFVARLKLLDAVEDFFGVVDGGALAVVSVVPELCQCLVVKSLSLMRLNPSKKTGSASGGLPPSHKWRNPPP